MIDLITYIGSLRNYFYFINYLKFLKMNILNTSLIYLLVYFDNSMMEEGKEKMNVEILVKTGDIISTHFQRIIKMLDDVDGEE